MKSGNINLNKGVLSVLFLMVVAVVMAGMASSCSKSGNASPTGLNTQLNIINVSPDVYPINLFINQRQQNAITKPYVYSVPSGYIYLASLDLPLQLRTQANTIIFEKDTALSTNCKYSVFITGLVAENTRTSIFVVDTDAAPTTGRGKVRFINASARSVSLDVYANGTLGYKSQGFKAVSKYQELPAGVYDFKIYAANTTTVYADLPNTTIQDGRLYTVYARGVIGRTDSAAFAASIITNR